jgi:hypothetical protein
VSLGNDALVFPELAADTNSGPDSTIQQPGTLLSDSANSIKEPSPDKAVLKDTSIIIEDGPDGIQKFLLKMVSKVERYDEDRLYAPDETFLLQTLERHPMLKEKDHSLWQRALENDCDEKNVPIAYISELTQSLMHFPLLLTKTADTVIDYEDALVNPEIEKRRLDPVIFTLK